MIEKGKGKPPAFMFYPADWLSDMKTRMLSWTARGLYIDLLCYCWREGYIPSDSKAIAQLSGCLDMDAVESCKELFTLIQGDGSKMIHKRLLEERQKQLDHAEERSKAGKKGAEARYGKRKTIDKSKKTR